VKTAVTPAWGMLYLAADVVLSAWMLRAQFRRRGRAALVAGVELLGGLCRSVPALAYLDAGFSGALDATGVRDALLRILFGIGLCAVLWFGTRDLRAGLRNPLHLSLPPRRRWLLFALGPGMIVAASIPEVWWAGLALAHRIS
jgi:hypothetical protein